LLPGGDSRRCANRAKEDEALVEGLYLPFGRQLEPHEVADRMVYAAWHANAMTGRTIHVNGARFMV
jgi:NAD(P)-dependent dehydrogenase (short-subunit alcohol dehydrogenase family)